jgi:hypothetical protein
MLLASCTMQSMNGPRSKATGVTLDWATHCINGTAKPVEILQAAAELLTSTVPFSGGQESSCSSDLGWHISRDMWVLMQWTGMTLVECQRINRTVTGIVYWSAIPFHRQFLVLLLTSCCDKGIAEIQYKYSCSPINDIVKSVDAVTFYKIY